jgi:hypothetical protein
MFSLLDEHLLKNLPWPLFSKEGNYSPLWKREVRRDFYFMPLLLIGVLVIQHTRTAVSFLGMVKPFNPPASISWKL